MELSLPIAGLRWEVLVINVGPVSSQVSTEAEREPERRKVGTAGLCWELERGSEPRKVVTCLEAERQETYSPLEPPEGTSPART